MPEPKKPITPTRQKTVKPTTAKTVKVVEKSPEKTKPTSPVVYPTICQTHCLHVCNVRVHTKASPVVTQPPTVGDTQSEEVSPDVEFTNASPSLDKLKPSVEDDDIIVSTNAVYDCDFELEDDEPTEKAPVKQQSTKKYTKEKPAPKKSDSESEEVKKSPKKKKAKMISDSASEESEEDVKKSKKKTITKAKGRTKTKKAPQLVEEDSSEEASTPVPTTITAPAKRKHAEVEQQQSLNIAPIDSILNCITRNRQMAYLQRYGDIDKESLVAEFQITKRIKLAKERGESIPEEWRPRKGRKLKQIDLEPDEEDLLERIKAQGKDCIQMVVVCVSAHTVDFDGDDEDDPEHSTRVSSRVLPKSFGTKLQSASSKRFSDDREESSYPRRPRTSKKQHNTNTDDKLLEMHSESSKVLRGMPIQLPQKEKTEKYSILNFFKKVQGQLATVRIPKASDVAEEIQRYENPQTSYDAPSQVGQHPDDDLVVLPPSDSSMDIVDDISSREPEEVKRPQSAEPALPNASDEQDKPAFKVPFRTPVEDSQALWEDDHVDIEPPASSTLDQQASLHLTTDNSQKDSTSATSTKKTPDLQLNYENTQSQMMQVDNIYTVDEDSADELPAKKKAVVQPVVHNNTLNTKENDTTEKVKPLSKEAIINDFVDNEAEESSDSGEGSSSSDSESDENEEADIPNEEDQRFVDEEGEDMNEEGWHPTFQDDEDDEKLNSLVNNILKGGWRKKMDSRMSSSLVDGEEEDDDLEAEEPQRYKSRRSNTKKKTASGKENLNLINFSIYKGDDNDKDFVSDDDVGETEHKESVTRRSMRLEMETALSQQTSGSLLDEEASQDILKLVEKTNVIRKTKNDKSQEAFFASIPTSASVDSTDSQDALPVSSFVKNNRKKLKELASSYNPSTSGPSISRFIFSKDNSNDASHAKDESSQPTSSVTKSSPKTGKPATSKVSATQTNEQQKGRLFNFLSQSKFGSK